MQTIKFNLNELENQKTGFYYYVLGRSYDLEENGLKRTIKLCDSRSKAK